MTPFYGPDEVSAREGRVMSALELLLTRDPVRARELADEANRTNIRRREQDQLLKEEAINMAIPYVKRGDPGLGLASSSWHKVKEDMTKK